MLYRAVVAFAVLCASSASAFTLAPATGSLALSSAAVNRVDVIEMGRGDKRTTKGKRKAKSFGVSRCVRAGSPRTPPDMRPRLCCLRPSSSSMLMVIPLLLFATPQAPQLRAAQEEGGRGRRGVSEQQSTQHSIASPSGGFRVEIGARAATASPESGSKGSCI